MADVEDVLALSPLQEGMFSLARLADGGVDVYTMQFVVSITGRLDADLLRRSLNEMLRRHPNVRASFRDAGLSRPVQMIPRTATVPWTQVTLSEAEIVDYAAALRRERFDLSNGPALRATLVDLAQAKGEYRLLLTAHHIVLDGWSVALFFTELVAVYAAGGTAATLAPVRPYRDYIGWLLAQDIPSALAVWEDYLQGMPGPLMLAESAVTPGTVAQVTALTLGRAATDGLVAWARDHGLTLNTLLQFAWGLVLSRLTDRTDVVFGTTVSGRPGQLTGVEQMVGLFLNTVAVRVQLAHDSSVVDICTRLQQDCVRLREVGMLRLSDVQRAAGHGGGLFDTLLVFENAPIGAAITPVDVGDIRFTPLEMESLAHYPVTIVAYHQHGELTLLAEVIHTVVPHTDAQQLVARVAAVLRAIPIVGQGNPRDIAVLLPGERELALAAGPPQPHKVDTFTHAFDDQARITAAAVALTTDTASYTYAQLRSSVAKLAALLVSHGVVPESVVALALPRTADIVIATLATLWSGGTVLPLDISAPPRRLADMVARAHPTVVLTHTGFGVPGVDDPVLLDDPHVAADIAGRPELPPARVHPDQAAYLVFTSGSTGDPKGVIGIHRALASYAADHQRRVYEPAQARLQRPLRIGHAWSMSFDAAWQPLVGLLGGHAVHLVSAAAMTDADRLVTDITVGGLDMLDTTPSLYRQLRAAAGPAGLPLAVLALGGEAVSATLWEQLRTLADTTVYNCYGPTETTVEALVGEVAAYAAPSIGTPNAGTAMSVLDSALQPTPVGCSGELYVTGEQLTRGYLGAPGATALRFVADAHRPGQRMYRTGDLVRQGASGALVCLGRADGQVKIRGYRVELGEIEAALRELAGVGSAQVVSVPRPGGATLVACVTPGSLDASWLRQQLAQRLPGYLLPGHLVVSDRPPLTSNGKLDTAALLTQCAHGDERAATPTEQALANALAELLGVQEVSATADFVALGADSITALGLVNRARAAGIPITARLVMQHTTIRDLATAADYGGVALGEPAEHRGGPVRLPALAAYYQALCAIPGTEASIRRMVQTQLVAVPPQADRETVTAVLVAVLVKHEMLRARQVDDQIHAGAQALSATDVLQLVELPGPATGTGSAVFAAAAAAAVERIDPAKGIVLQAVWFTQPAAPNCEAGVLLLTAHHFAVDVVSWHILLADVLTAWHCVQADKPITLAAPTTSYRRWCQCVAERARGGGESQRPFWQRQLGGTDPVLGVRRIDPRRDRVSATATRMITTSAAVTAELFAGAGHEGSMPEKLMTALVLTVSGWRRQRGQITDEGVLVAVEGHGRVDDLFTDVDTSGTLGWFTTMYPVRLGVGTAITADQDAVARLLSEVGETLAAVPHRGFDYGLLQWDGAPVPQIVMNYLGRLDLAAASEAVWQPIGDPTLHALLPDPPEPNQPLCYAWEVVPAVTSGPQGPQLRTTIRYATELFDDTAMAQWDSLWNAALAAVAACATTVAVVA